MDMESYCVDINKSHAISLFSQGFDNVLARNYNDSYSDIVLMCVGTDRSTGDSLGPLVGHKLRHIKYKGIQLFGTLEDPVHAKNLKEVTEDIYKEYSNPFIISIDACLGKFERVGFISIGNGPIRPGAGVNKNLPEVGNMHVVGIVNVGGFMEYLILQNTRLNLIMRMADIISVGMYYSLSRKTLPLQSEDRNASKKGGYIPGYQG